MIYIDSIKELQRCLFASGKITSLPNMFSMRLNAFSGRGQRIYLMDSM